jgi:hypothetical protein
MRQQIEPFRHEWNDFAHRSTRSTKRGTAGTVTQGKMQESRATPWFLAVPQGGTLALKERLKVSFRVTVRSIPFPRGPRGTVNRSFAGNRWGGGTARGRAAARG